MPCDRLPSRAVTWAEAGRVYHRGIMKTHSDDTKRAARKYEELLALLRTYERVAVAFSGGVDSTLLLHAAREELGADALALVATSALFPRRETDEALAFCAQRGIACVEVPTRQLDDARVVGNAPDRCYACKLQLLGSLLDEAREQGVQTLVEGSNADDDPAKRPGMRAVAELGVASPLAAVGLAKAEIRALSRELGLPTWDKQSYACLATRFSPGVELEPAQLARVDAAEQVLLDLGFSPVRVRVNGDDARIEVAAAQIARAAAPPVRERVDAALRALGFAHVSVDLTGYVDS